MQCFDGRRGMWIGLRAISMGEQCMVPPRKANEGGAMSASEEIVNWSVCISESAGVKVHQLLVSISRLHRAIYRSTDSIVISLPRRRHRTYPSVDLGVDH